MINTCVLLAVCRMVDAPAWCHWLLAFELILQAIAFGIKLEELANRD